jgi:hypothetical protein
MNERQAKNSQTDDFFSSVQPNLAMATSAITMLLYGMGALAKLQPIAEEMTQHIITRRKIDSNNPLLKHYKITDILNSLNHNAFAISTLHYFFALGLVALGLYYYGRRQGNKWVAFVFTTILMFMLGFNTLYMMSTTAKLSTSDYLPVLGITLLILGIIVYKWHQKSKKEALALNHKIALTILIAGCAMVLSTTFISIDSSLLKFNVINMIIILGCMSGFVIHATYKAYKKNKADHKSITPAIMTGIITGGCAIGLLGYAFIAWLCHPSVYRHEVQHQVLNFAMHYSIYGYTILSGLFALLHFFRLISSFILIFKKNENDSTLDKRYCVGNFILCSLNLTLDICFIVYCAVPMWKIADLNSTMSKTSGILDKAGLVNQMGKLLPESTQICLFVFAGLMIARLVWSAAIWPCILSASRNNKVINNADVTKTDMNMIGKFNNVRIETTKLSCF